MDLYNLYNIFYYKLDIFEINKKVLIELNFMIFLRKALKEIFFPMIL